MGGPHTGGAARRRVKSMNEIQSRVPYAAIAPSPA
jgi:hypothetical protein